jgi:hypothetical protein
MCLFISLMVMQFPELHDDSISPLMMDLAMYV